jgi:hypothetical protein
MKTQAFFVVLPGTRIPMVAHLESGPVLRYAVNGLTHRHRGAV